MSAPPRTAVYTLGSRPELFQRGAVFLSASIPYDKKFDPAQDSARYRDNQRYLATARPEAVREAVAQLCRYIFQQGLNLVFGAHPAISPMALDLARRFTPPAERQEKRVIIFQSDIFRDSVPSATLELANWEAGELLWTAQQGDPTWPDHGRAASLLHMRELMVQSPSLLAAVFIGGMEGVVDESRLFAQYNWGKLRYAIGSTGSASAELLATDEAHHSGNHPGPAMRKLLGTSPSYPLVIERIFADLGVP